MYWPWITCQPPISSRSSRVLTDNTADPSRRLQSSRTSTSDWCHRIVDESDKLANLSFCRRQLHLSLSLRPCIGSSPCVPVGKRVRLMAATQATTEWMTLKYFWGSDVPTDGDSSAAVAGIAAALPITANARQRPLLLLLWRLQQRPPLQCLWQMPRFLLMRAKRPTLCRFFLGFAVLCCGCIRLSVSVAVAAADDTAVPFLWFLFVIELLFSCDDLMRERGPTQSSEWRAPHEFCSQRRWLDDVRWRPVARQLYVSGLGDPIWVDGLQRSSAWHIARPSKKITLKKICMPLIEPSAVTKQGLVRSDGYVRAISVSVTDQGSPSTVAYVYCCDI